MIPLSDDVRARRFPFVNVALIVANFAVFLFYELPNGDAAVNQASGSVDDNRDDSYSRASAI